MADGEKFLQIKILIIVSDCKLKSSRYMRDIADILQQRHVFVSKKQACCIASRSDHLSTTTNYCYLTTTTTTSILLLTHRHKVDVALVAHLHYFCRATDQCFEQPYCFSNRVS